MTKPLPKSRVAANAAKAAAAPAKKTAPSPGTRTVFLDLDGEKVRPKDAFWVVFNPKGTPIHFFTSDIAVGNSVASAARTHWMGSGPALEALNEGYRLELVSPKRFVAEIVQNLRPDDTSV